MNRNILIFLLVIFVVLNAFTDIKYSSNQFKESIYKNNEFYFLKLNHVQQERKLCVPASCVMALDFYGYKINQRTLALKISERSGKGKGTKSSDAVLAVNKLGFQWQSIKFTDLPKLGDLIAELHRKHPPIVAIDVPGGPTHALILVGYDNIKKNLFFLDPAISESTPNPQFTGKPPYLGATIMSVDKFLKVWKERYIRTGPSINKNKPLKLTESELALRNKDLLSQIQASCKRARSWLPNKNAFSSVDHKSVKLILENDWLRGSTTKVTELRKFFSTGKLR